MIESFNDVPKNGKLVPLNERRNKLFHKLGFKYFENKDLDNDKPYVLLDSNSPGWMRFVSLSSNRSNSKVLSFGGYLAHSMALLPFSELVGKEVVLKSKDGTFKGKINYPCLLDEKHNMFCRVYWFQGQKNVPHGWVNVNSLQF